MIKNVIKGMLIGIANIIPGVSGGTMAVSMGIYDRLIRCISHPFEDFKNNVLFLIPIALGMGLSIIASAFGIDYLFETFPLQTNLLFIGLILGSMPAIYGKVKGVTCIKTQIKNGKVVDIENSEFYLNANSIIFAIGLIPESKTLEQNGIVIENKMVKVDENYMTNIEGVFAGGDLVETKSTVCRAIATGKKVAKTIIGHI